MFSHSWIRCPWLTRTTCFEAHTEDRAVRHKSLVVIVKWRKSPLMEREAWGQVELGRGMDGGGSCPCHPVSQSAAGRHTIVSTLLTTLCIKSSLRRFTRFQNTHLVFVGGYLMVKHSVISLSLCRRRHVQGKSWSSRPHRCKQWRSVK